MQSASYCVYNQTRNTLLAEHVAFVSDPQSPEQLLSTVLNGPGRTSQSAVLLNTASAAPDMPRLFAFDVAYLDAEQKIIEAAGVGPATAFPEFDQNVRSVLFLADQSLERSSTAPGDAIKICTEAELAVLLRSASQAIPETPRVQPFHFPQFNDVFDSNPRPVTNDPFNASLMYLPHSGSPSTSEFFLQFRPAATPVPDTGAGSLSELEDVLEISDSEIVESAAFQPQEVERESEGLPEEPRSISSTTYLGSFKTAFGLTDPHIEPPSEHEQAVAPEFSSLPRSLKAIIQLVDEQLRREQSVPDPHSASEPPETVDESTLVEAFDFDSSAEQDRMELDTPSLPTHVEEVQTLIDDPIDARLKWEEVEPPVNASFDSPAGILSPDFEGDEITALHPTERMAESPSPISRSDLQSRELPPEWSELEDPHSPPAKVQPPAVPSTGKELERAAVAAHAKEKLSFATRVQRWLSGDSISISGNRRRGERVSLPGLVAFYFTGGAPKPHDIVNISSSGLYLRSKEMWYPNTLVRMTLERPIPERDEKKSISVLARVVRVDDGGIGHEFVTSEALQRLHARELLHEQGTNRKELERFLALR